MDDVVIIGGSFAGLAAALQLARARCKVTVVDAGQPRNRFADAAHAVLGFDGVPPGEILKRALDNVLAYPTVRHLVGEVVAARGSADGFEVALASGDVLPARRLILAYGVADQLPPIPGFAECWGKSVIHCPYCHGYEFADGRLGLLYSGPHSMHMPSLLRDWSSDLTLVMSGAELEPVDREQLVSRGVAIVDEPLQSILHENGRMRGIVLEGGRELPLDALYAHPKLRASSALHEDFGLEMAEGPLGAYVKVDEFGQTSMPGIFAAGDLVRAWHSITFALAGGVAAAATCHRSLLV